MYENKMCENQFIVVVNCEISFVVKSLCSIFFLIILNLIIVLGCGGNFGVSNQDNVFIFLGYFSGYVNNLNCLWMIIMLFGNCVWFNIFILDLEGYFMCFFDSIIVYDSQFLIKWSLFLVFIFL